jgi:Glycosyltransferase family 87
VALALAPLVVATVIARMRSMTDEGVWVDEFAANIWLPGRDVLAGRDPLLEAVYPPIAYVLTLPFALPPMYVSYAVWTVMLVACVVLALRMCGVADPRVYLVALLTPSIAFGLLYGNVSLLLMLAVAAIWAWRQSPWRSGLLVGLVIAGKLFLWPLAVWLLVTGRRRAAAVALGSAAVFTLVGFAAIGFASVTQFAELSRDNVAMWSHFGHSVAAIVAQAEASPTVTSLVALACGGAALGVAYARRGDDLTAFTWAIAAACLASPIVWTHYFALLLVPLALVWPRLGPVWLLPFVLLPQLLEPESYLQALLAAELGVLFVVAVPTLVGVAQSRTSSAASSEEPRPIGPIPRWRAWPSLSPGSVAAPSE